MMKCRHCHTPLSTPLIDLGSSPPSNAYLSKQKLLEPEVWFPLRVLVCEQCWLVQTEDHAGRELLFDDEYAYFSSFSTTWLKHAEQYVSDMVGRFGLTNKSTVVEIAANDGYLLQFVQSRNIPCYGIEPTASTAAAARLKDIDIIEKFFGTALAKDLCDNNRQADLITANNVLAHVPDINDFVSGFTTLLKPTGIATFEFPHLLQLINENQFDTIYHEHYSYLSLTAVETIFNANGLQVFDVEQLPTHGGSLRVFACRADCSQHHRTERVQQLLEKEISTGLKTVSYYSNFQSQADSVKNNLLHFLLDMKHQNKTIIAYGAAAKGNTLLNYAGVRPDLLPCVVDKNPAKQNKFLPGSRIPIVTEEFIIESQPDYILILPWNLQQEIYSQLNYVRGWGAKFVTAVPKLTIE
jgi:SAM-dependent methyltransferase